MMSSPNVLKRMQALGVPSKKVLAEHQPKVLAPNVAISKPAKPPINGGGGNDVEHLQGMEVRSAR